MSALSPAHWVEKSLDYSDCQLAASILLLVAAIILEKKICLKPWLWKPMTRSG
jgi:hypothetical protein